SELIVGEGSYGVVSQMSRNAQGSRQTLYSWKTKGQRALAAAFEPRKPQVETVPQLDRAVLTLLVEAHASYRGIQACLWGLLGEQVSLGTIVQQAGERAQHWLAQQAPGTERAL